MFAHCYARGAQQSSFEDSQSGSSMGNKEGLLMKRGEKRKNWLERRFVFNAQARTLSYFDPTGSGGLKGAGVLQYVEDVPNALNQRANRFDIVLDHQQRGCVSAVEVAALTEADKADWLRVFRATDVEEPFLADEGAVSSADDPGRPLDAAAAARAIEEDIQQGLTPSVWWQRTWTENNPSVWVASTESAPLPYMRRPNAVAHWTVN